ncbi:helix-turn-helix domain-containing protein [Hymenobacter montanus]|nr:helix-turn-helix domain-containing protein [Hymenobacter montanus]
MIVLTIAFYDEMATRLADIIERRLTKLYTATKPTHDADALMTVEDCAKRLKLCKKTVLSRIESGLLVATNYGSDKRPRWRVTNTDLKKLLLAHGQR